MDELVSSTFSNGPGTAVGGDWRRSGELTASQRGSPYRTLRCRTIAGVLMVLLSFAFLLAVPGCKTTSQRSPLAKAAGIRVKKTELESRVRNFAGNFRRVVESTADEIILKSQDPVVRRNARLWKMNSIAACYRAALEEDPLVGLLDTWLLCVQMRQFFEEGAGSDLFGEMQEIAVQASTRLEKRMIEVAKFILDSSRGIEPGKGDDYSQIESAHERIVKLAEQTPIEDVQFTRESLIPHLSQIYREGSTRFFASIGSLTRDVEDILSNVTVVLELLPRQLTWQTEILIEDTLAQQDIQSALSSVDTISSIAAELTPIIQDIPLLVERERVEILLMLHEEITRVLEELSNERVATINDVEMLSNSLIDKSTAEIVNLVDHVFWRAIELSAAIVALVVLAIVVARKTRKPGAKSRKEA